MKLYRRPVENPMFPNEPDMEANLLRALAGRGIAPQLEESFHSAFGPCNIYRHLSGKPWSEGFGCVGKLMQKLHSISPPSGLRHAPNGSEALKDQTLRILALCQDGSGLIDLAPSGIVPPTTNTCLLHGDIVPGNLIDSDAGLFLIDWQCPATGDPCEDIAVFLSPAMQRLYLGPSMSPKTVAEFLRAYGSDDIAARYAALCPWYHWRMAAYCQWQVENGQADYEEARELEIAALQRSLRR